MIIGAGLACFAIKYPSPKLKVATNIRNKIAFNFLFIFIDTTSPLPYYFTIILCYIIYISEKNEILKKLEEHDKRFDGHDKKFDEIGKRFDKVFDKFNEHDKRFDKVESSITQLRQDILEGQDRMMDILQRLDQERIFTAQ